MDPSLAPDPKTPEYRLPADAFAFILLLDQPYHHIPALVRALAATRKPVAVVDELCTWSVRDTVPEKSQVRVFSFTSGQEAARKIVRTLVQYGHRRFAFISPYGYNAWSIVREKAIRQELEGAGVQTSFTALSFRGADAIKSSRRQQLQQAPQLVKDAVKHLPPFIRDYFSEDLLIVRFRSELATRETQKVIAGRLGELLQPSCPTAWITVNDDVASVALQFLRANKIAVPGDISLVSFDDSTFAMDQGISSYNFNATAVASAVVNYCVNPRVFSSQKYGERIEIGGVLVERETIGPVKS
jgi:DNA-binding LacI/PurR family transcriptional regulator